MSVYGGRAQTANIDKLASQGVAFSSAISHFPETALSHWSMMTSVVPEVHGNVPANGGSIYKGPTLAEIARQHGYATGAFIGGVTMQDSACGMRRGFDVYDDQFRFTQEDMSRNGNEVTANALQWIAKQERQNKTYFAFLHYFDAHFPYTPAAPWDKRYDPNYNGSIDGTDAVLRPYRDGQKTPTDRDIAHVLALYDGEISELDGKIKKVLDGVGDDVLVVITSDHGESFGHGYYFNHRAGLWDSVVRVPLIMRGPGIPKGKMVSEQVGLIDILPTLIELAGLRGDKRFQGKSLVSLMDGTGSGSDIVYSITDPWMENPQFAVRSPDWKWISQPDRELVYNISNDPEEKRELSSIPDDFASSKQEYSTLIESKRQYQSKMQGGRSLSKEDCARLEALGYTTCKDQKR